MPAPGRKAWSLSAESFDRLLDFLHADRHLAAQEYETIRAKLIRFFEWKGCVPGAEFADETMDRVARRLEQGLQTQTESPYVYVHGVARNVVHERWRRPRAADPLESAPAVEPFESERRQSAVVENERRLGCLEDCLDRLTPASRELLISYHLGGSGVHIGRRRQLAERLNLPATALRLRVYRSRRQLERCMTRCLGGRTIETFPE